MSLGQATWVYAHILLMVFWIGADIGVFLAGLFFMNPRLGVAQRATAIEVGLVIDRLPRLCFILMLPVGAHLAAARAVPGFDDGVALAVWPAALIWLAAAVIGMVRPNTPLAARAHLVERVFQWGGFLGLSAVGLSLIMADAGFVWMGVKLVVFGVICLSVVFLERSFMPTMMAFAEIQADGSTPERESRVSRGMITTYGWVLAIYAAVLAAGWFGVAKPF